jgi:hypothetical protein
VGRPTFFLFKNFSIDIKHIFVFVVLINMGKSFAWIKINLCLFFVTFYFSAFSQDGNPLQFLSAVSQSSAINPAFQNKTEKLVVGLPIMSGVNVRWNGNLEVSNLINYNFATNLYDILDESANASTAAQIPLIFLSLKKNSSTFSFSVSEKAVGITSIDKEIINLISEGILPFYGANEDLGPISFKMQYNREIAFGYSTQISKKLSVGIRPKIVFNKFFYDVDITNFRVETLEETEQLKITPEGNYTLAGPVKISIDEENEVAQIKSDIKPADYFFRLKNMGAGIDLGLTYKLTKQIEISLSAIDIGFIGVKDNKYNIEFTESLDYKKYRLYQSSDSSASSYWSPSYAMSAFGDSIPYITSINEMDERKLEALPLKINAMFKYSLSGKREVGFSNHYSYYNRKSENYFSGFIHTGIGKKFEAVATLNLYKLERIMPGIGGSYTGENTQFYLSTNNILELLQPTSAKNLNLSFGMNFLFSTD